MLGCCTVQANEDVESNIPLLTETGPIAIPVSGLIKRAVISMHPQVSRRMAEDSTASSLLLFSFGLAECDDTLQRKCDCANGDRAELICTSMHVHSADNSSCQVCSLTDATVQASTLQQSAL